MKRTTCLALILAALLISSCGTGQEAKNGVPANVPEIAESAETDQTDTECKICDVDESSYSGPLSKAEVRGLLLALNDEYKAWATYERINKSFGSPRPFLNIQRAEAKHIDRLKPIFVKYEVKVPGNPWTDDAPEFGSLLEACKAGVAGEIANRDLYNKLIESTDREDIVSVYKALQSASANNHLPAFERCVARTS
ncbi:MAG: DUF2202 domain-containing protein [Acidobacteria bacterium]|nr:MAG: DUF2202 domain-containing protein [Acidobacteriota bacterium]REK02028.1 MAG: DUF2202 domain-containing protein [Acidobacteriota bacterium]REK14986.1 MAG: DUF2202 domain-containing protein [Acidobacteriota bacterium]REK45700.1 MAG: DUF2202 domain-containing protein [Acidobacteriota bacterium]